jgi:hypothetical protein
MSFKREREDKVIPEVNELHTQGIDVYRNVFVMDSVLKDAFDKYSMRRMATIFNHNDKKKNDRKRKQISFRPNNIPLKRWYTHMTDFLKEQYPNLYAYDWVVIKSHDKCQEQAPHSDFEPSKELKAVADEFMPLGVLIAIQPDTRLKVWKGSIELITGKKKCDEEITGSYVTMNPGDMCVFRGDVIHAGCGYETENYRLHVYLDSPKVARTLNRTYLVSKTDFADIII